MPLHSQNSQREAVRQRQCPTCGAAEGELCKNSKGGNRTSNHIARKVRDGGLLDRTRYIERYLQRYPVPESSGFVVYAISGANPGDFVYVGQTGDFGKRVRAHLRNGFKQVRHPPIRKWLFEQISSERDPVFLILETCVNEAASLQRETEWVRTLSADGHHLLNNWKVHKSIILARNRLAWDEPKG